MLPAMEWRRATWAAKGALIFVTGASMAVTWWAAGATVVATSSKGLPWWPLLAFGFLMLMGLVAFLVAMAVPRWLPFHKIGQQEDEEAERLRDRAEQRKRAHSALRDIFHYETPRERSNRELAEALREHSKELRAYRTAQQGDVPLGAADDKDCTQ